MPSPQTTLPRSAQALCEVITKHLNGFVIQHKVIAERSQYTGICRISILVDQKFFWDWGNSQGKSGDGTALRLLIRIEDSYIQQIMNGSLPIDVMLENITTVCRGFMSNYFYCPCFICNEESLALCVRLCPTCVVADSLGCPHGIRSWFPIFSEDFPKNNNCTMPLVSMSQLNFRTTRTSQPNKWFATSTPLFSFDLQTDFALNYRTVRDAINLWGGYSANVVRVIGLFDNFLAKQGGQDE